MADRVNFSEQEQSLEEIIIHYRDVQSGLFEFFSSNSRALNERYDGTTITDARAKSLAELELTSCLSLLSSIEAALRLNYLRRVHGIAEKFTDVMSAYNAACDRGKIQNV